MYRKVTGNVSGKTSMLIVGSILEDGRAVSESRKYKTAQDKGTKILTESELDDLIYKSIYYIEFIVIYCEKRDWKEIK